MSYTNFDGKPLSFVPGKEKPNKEPAVSKFVVEKLYKVHRERIRDMVPIVDCKMEIPEFMNNQSWKKITEEHRKEVIRMENEVIYQRIAKMENGESAMTKASRLHKRRVENELKLMKSLKLKGRIRDFLKLQRENEDMLRRIERARPEYSVKNCREWYKHHELFKQGRRSDPTGGHLGFTTLKGLLPKKLDKSEKTNLDLAMDASMLIDESLVSDARPKTVSDVFASRGNSRSGKKARAAHLAATGSVLNSTTNKYAQSILSKRSSDPRARTAGSASSFARIEAQNSMFDLDEMKQKERMGGAGNIGSDGTPAKPTQGASWKSGSMQAKTPTSPITSGRKNSKNSPVPRSNLIKRGVTEGNQKKQSHSASSVQFSSEKQPRSGIALGGGDGANADDDYADETFDAAEGALKLPTEGSIESLYSEGGTSLEIDMKILLSRGYSIPFQSAGCTLRILCRTVGEDENTKFDEHITLQAVTNTTPRVLLATRTVHIDEVYNIINSDVNQHKIHAVADGGDLVSLRALLIQMFKEADDDGNGYLTYDEFEMLMDKVELGIKPSDLRYVIQEADENENGVVEFEEFVPLAVDMIQSFRALNRARIYCSQQGAMFEEEVRTNMEQIDFEAQSTVIMDKLYEHDPRRYGVMRVTEFKRCLNSVAYQAGLSENSISMIIHKLPSDNFGRLLYNGVSDVTKKVKFIELKQELVQAQATPLQERLYNSCRRTEIARLDETGGDSNTSGAIGILNEGDLANILANSDSNLSRLQICVLMVAGKDANDDIDYVQFLPIAAKAIEYMFEPKALRQRAELIDKTDLSSENLLNTLGKDGEDALAEKFKGLFETCDVDHSGLMGIDEFMLCMKALDFYLSDEELEAYFSSIPAQYSKDEDGTLIPEITFTDAVNFLRDNIRALERKKQNRILTATLHETVVAIGNAEEKEGAKKDMEKRLGSLFSLGDEDNTGFLTSDEMYRLLTSLDLDITEVELDMILAEADRMDGDEDGLIDYKLFLPVCVDLLMTYLANKAGNVEDNKNQKMAGEQADAIVAASKDEIMQISSYIRTRLIVIDEGVQGESNRYQALYDILHDFHSGLTKTEATAIHDHFLSKAKGISSPSVENHKSLSKQRESVVLDDDDIGTPNSSKFKHLTKDQMRRTKKSKLAKLASKALPAKVSLKKSLDELIDLITKVRHASIKRNIVKQLNPESCSQLILNKIDELREEHISQGSLSKTSIFVPARLCFQALQQLQELRLSQPQILSIISWAECYDTDGMRLDYARFSDHAAKVISKLFLPDQLESRGKILASVEFEDSYMGGLGKEDLDEYLRQAIGSRTSLSMEEFSALLIALPLLNISRNEAVATAAGHQYDHEKDELNAESVVELSFDLVRHICRERHINRRMALQIAAKGKNEEALSELTTLAEKFADFVKVRRHTYHRSRSIAPVSGLTGLSSDLGGQMAAAGLKILLPSDAKEPSKEHTDGKSPSTKLIAGTLDGDDEDAGEGLADEEVVLFDAYVEVPVQEAPLAPSDSTQGGPRRFSLHPTMTSHKAASRKSIREETDHRRSSVATSKMLNEKIKPIAPLPVFKKPDKLPAYLDGTLKVIAVEKGQSMDRELIITLSYDEESKTCSTTETVKLPMLCSVDVEMAQEFVKGLVPRVFCEMAPIGTTPYDPVLIVADLEAEDAGENNFGMYFD